MKQDRFAAYDERQKKAGFRRVAVRVHESHIERLKKYAARLRKEKRSAE